jgi:hypothetical protein
VNLLERQHPASLSHGPPGSHPQDAHHRGMLESVRTSLYPHIAKDADTWPGPPAAIGARTDFRGTIGNRGTVGVQRQIPKSRGRDVLPADTFLILSPLAASVK